MAHHITTRKSTKTNEIIDKNFLSVIFIDGKNFRLHLCQYIPRDNTRSDTVGLYRWNMSVGIY